MVKSAKAYQDEFYGAGKKALDTQKTEWAKQDASYIEEISGINNKAAQNTADKIQQQINQAPVASRALYDANALDEAISKKKLQESMTNMGLTDSGLSSSMQTALALQKTRADAGVRRQEREYVQGLENAIADVWAQTEAANAKMAASRQQATVDRYNQGLTDLYSDSLTAGAEAYAADMEANTKANEAVIKQNEKIATATANFIKEGYDPVTAQQMACWTYGIDTGENVNPNAWTKPKAEIPDYVLERISAHTYDDKLNDEINRMLDLGVIDEEQGNTLLAMYGTGLVSPDSEDWVMVSDGGNNYGGGIDEDAEAKLKVGKNARGDDIYKTYTMKDLYETLQIEYGLTKDQAEEYVEILQKRLKLVKK